jgi:hypothetical protein
VELVLGVVEPADLLVEVPVAVEFCAGVEADGEVVLVVEFWAGGVVVVELVDVDGDWAKAAVASTKLIAEVASKRIFISKAPVEVVAATSTAISGTGSAKPGKTGNASLRSAIRD